MLVPYMQVTRLGLQGVWYKCDRCGRYCLGQLVKSIFGRPMADIPIGWKYDSVGKPGMKRVKHTCKECHETKS